MVMYSFIIFFQSGSFFQTWNISQQAEKPTSFSHSMILEYLAKGPKILKRNKQTNKKSYSWSLCLLVMLNLLFHACSTQRKFWWLSVLMAWWFIFIRKGSFFSIHFQWFQGKNMKLWLREVFLLTPMLLRTSHSVCCGRFIEELHPLSFNHATHLFTVQNDVKLIQWHCVKFQSYFDFFLNLIFSTLPLSR